MPSSLLHIVLYMVHHGSALTEDRRHGGAMHYRYLNATGRWSARGTAAVPLLTWPDRASAEQAARLATQARRRPVEVSNVTGTNPDHFLKYTDEMQPALQGYLPYTEAASRKLEAERHKTMTYARAIVAASNGRPLQEVNGAIRDALGAGSVVQAAQFMTGKRCASIVQSVLDGELMCDSDLTPPMLVTAALLARRMVGQLGKGHEQPAA